MKIKNFKTIIPGVSKFIKPNRSRSFCLINNKINILDISRKLLELTKNDINKAIINLEDLTKLDNEIILTQLSDDNKKKTFWINIYNILIKIALQNSKMKSIYPKFEFFKVPILEIGGINLSLDDIEHKILRRSKIKLSLGYLTNPFPKTWERDFRVIKLDFRIHFALNCGAKSCPLIQSYHENLIDQQLDKATKKFLTNDSAYDYHKNTLELSKIFYWFLADFGGKNGIIRLHQEYRIIPIDKRDVKIIYREYNWNVESDNFI